MTVKVANNQPEPNTCYWPSGGDLIPPGNTSRQIQVHIAGRFFCSCLRSGKQQWFEQAHEATDFIWLMNHRGSNGPTNFAFLVWNHPSVLRFHPYIFSIFERVDLNPSNMLEVDQLLCRSSLVNAYGAINDPLRFWHFLWLEASCSSNWCMHHGCHVTGLGWGGDVNVHVNLRHMHNWRHVQGWVEFVFAEWLVIRCSWVCPTKQKKTIILFRRIENRWTFRTKRTFGSWPQCNYDLTFLSHFYKTLPIPWFGEPSIMKNPWITPGR